MRRWLLIFLVVGGAAASVYYRRETVRNSTDYSDPLRYERMSAVGISVDYRKEPLLAWKIIAGTTRLELTGGGQNLSCMDEHLLFGRPFDALKQPVNVGEALDHCNSKLSK